MHAHVAASILRFDELLSSLAAECDFIYLPSPANVGEIWDWKDLTHLHAVE
jgi:hypothetical protein